MTKRFFIATAVVLVLLGMGANLSWGQIEDIEKKLNNNPDNPELLLQLGRLFHNRAVESHDGDAVRKAEKYLDRLLKLEPENATAMVYSGSLQTLKARDSSMPWEAMDHMSEGFSRMDKAVLSAPENPEVRLIRGVNSLQIPAQFGRLSTALEDFKALDGMAPEKLSALGKDFVAEVHFSYATALLRDGNRAEAIAKYRQVLETAPDSPLAEMARKQLTQLEKKP